MSRITDAFKKHKALVVFLTGGDPDIETTERLILAMADEGADLIEIGVPFSDPIAEGPVIRAASERALGSGTTLDDLFALVRRLRARTDIPIVFMTYFNPVYRYGVGDFTERCATHGVDGVIIPDLPWEERGEYLSRRTADAVELISLVTPTSEARAGGIAPGAEGFLYCVSSLGVTGVRESIGTEIGEVISAVKAERKDLPCAIGFGVSTPEQAREMAQLADGVIVGSAIVRIIAEHGRDSEPHVRGFVRSLRAAVI
jgi:tryptophan synthase alpha chain